MSTNITRRSLLGMIAAIPAVGLLARPHNNRPIGPGDVFGLMFNAGDGIWVRASSPVDLRINCIEFKDHPDGGQVVRWRSANKQVGDTTARDESYRCEWPSGAMKWMGVRAQSTRVRVAVEFVRRGQRPIRLMKRTMLPGALSVWREGAWLHYDAAGAART